MKKNFYFCTVKTTERHEVAVKVQRFLLPTFKVELDTKRIKVCGSSNAHGSQLSCTRQHLERLFY